MSCMCGDPYCWSCGPAQGNFKCPACGRWSMDGGCENPEACLAACRRMDEEMAKQEEEFRRAEEEWHRTGGG